MSPPAARRSCARSSAALGAHFRHEGAPISRRESSPRQPQDDGNADIAWNFTKFLVNGAGEVVARYAPQVTPEDIGKDIPGIL